MVSLIHSSRQIAPANAAPRTSATRPIYLPLAEGKPIFAKFERKMGEEFGGDSAHGYEPRRLYYYSKKVHRPNRYADTGIWNFYGFHPVGASLTYSREGTSSVVFSDSGVGYSNATTAGEEFVPLGYAATAVPLFVLAMLHTLEDRGDLETIKLDQASVQQDVGRIIWNTWSASHIRKEEDRPSPGRALSVKDGKGNCSDKKISRGALATIVQTIQGLTHGGHHSMHAFPEENTQQRQERSTAGDPHVHEIELEHIALLAHLDAGRSSVNPWFMYHMLVHRHEDDIDRKVEEHAVHEEVALLEQEIEAELHFHLSELHRDFAGWWAEWHQDGAVSHEQWAVGNGHWAMGEEEVEAGGEERPHHEDTGSYGRHAAEWYWWLMSEWGLTIEALQAHTHIAHFGLYLHAGDATHEPDHGTATVAHSMEVEDLEDFNGWRHGFNHQADGWWMYRTTHQGAVHAGAAHGVAESGAAAGHGTVNGGEATDHESGTHGTSDWKRIELGLSPYSFERPEWVTPRATHEIPPTE